MDMPPTIGVILAGGRARRMGGGDKTLLRLGGQTLVEHVVERLWPQCPELILSANGDPARFAPLGLEIVPDTVPDGAGPLAGILAAFEWVSLRRPEVGRIVSVSGDAPFLPPDLVRRLQGACKNTGRTIAYAASGGQEHPVVGLWSVTLKDELRRAVTIDQVRKVGSWAALHGAVAVRWKTEPVDPFFNINRPEDLLEAEARMAILDEASMKRKDLRG